MVEGEEEVDHLRYAEQQLDSLAEEIAPNERIQHSMIRQSVAVLEEEQIAGRGWSSKRLREVRTVEVEAFDWDCMLEESVRSTDVEAGWSYQGVEVGMCAFHKGSAGGHKN